MTSAEKLKYLYDILPERFIAYQWAEKASIILSVSTDTAREYLRKMEVLGMIKQVGTFEFEKGTKTQKTVRLEDL